MVDLISEIETKHQLYINWLETQRSNFEIAQYISYVKDKKECYKRYEQSRDISWIDQLPRAMNRYLDEFAVDLQFTRQSYTFLYELSALIGELIRAQNPKG